METVLLNEIIEKTATFTSEERQSLIKLLQEQENKPKANGGKGYVHPNTIWIKKHHAEYAGKYVALKDGELVAVGNTIKEVDLKAKEKKVEKPLLTYLFPLDEVPFGGW
ncbi:MAG: hypothetical protein H0V31_06200 [Acidobacteria bacterium]|nr:hypothetical protein [Acidobacteriota bacterium]